MINNRVSLGSTAGTVTMSTFEGLVPAERFA